VELYEAVKRCAELVERYRTLGSRIGEENTKAALIEPIIAALGWDVLDPEEVHREYRRRPSDNPVDYALLLFRTPRLFIEAKGLGEDLSDPRWEKQTIGYAVVAGVEWVALTDGATWKVYNAHAPVPVEQKLFRQVHIDKDADASVELLALLGKDNMRDNRIGELWKGFFVDRQVRRALQELFSGDDPPRDLLALVAKRVPKLSRGEVRASLMRARAVFDFPVAEPLPPEAPTASTLPEPSPVTRQAKPTTVEQPRVSATERQTRLRDIMAAGRLRAGDILEATYRGQRHTAVVRPDGKITYRGVDYDSPSGAGVAVKVAVLGPDVPAQVKATDGWAFWQATDAISGDRVALKELRRRVALSR